MKEVKIYNVKPAAEWMEGMGDTLFFRYVGEAEDGSGLFRFFPRPYNGGATLSGFYFQLGVETGATWNDFLIATLEEPFLSAYWRKHRNGFHAQKYYFKLYEEFGVNDFGQPPRMKMTGRLNIPEWYENALVERGVALGAFESNDL